MRRLLLFLLLALSAPAEEKVVSYSLLVDAEPSTGFCWPYYLYVPPQCVQAGDVPFPLLVIPNNSGVVDDDWEKQRANAAEELSSHRRMADILGCPVLVTTFPRPATQWQLYTHALDRDTLLKGTSTLNRLDLQMLATLQNSRLRLAAHGIKVRPKVWMYGFSAAAMFVNRFALLHPEVVDSVAAGSPGGWPMAPVGKSAGKELPYPVGSSDLITLIGQPLQLAEARQIRFFFFLGDHDLNDSVAYDDGYDGADRQLIHELFGLTPLERWPKAEQLYKLAQLNARFKLYPGLGHETTADTRKDVIEFFQAPSVASPDPQK